MTAIQHGMRCPRFSSPAAAAKQANPSCSPEPFAGRHAHCSAYRSWRLLRLAPHSGDVGTLHCAKRSMEPLQDALCLTSAGHDSRVQLVRLHARPRMKERMHHLPTRHARLLFLGPPCAVLQNSRCRSSTANASRHTAASALRMCDAITTQFPATGAVSYKNLEQNVLHIDIPLEAAIALTAAAWSHCVCRTALTRVRGLFQ